MTRLLDHSIDSDGISPTEIFGLDRDTMMTAFREYVQKNEKYKQKHPMKQKLKEYEEMRKRLNKQRSKEKHKHQERSL